MKQKRFNSLVILNILSANSTKRSNTLKQFVGFQQDMIDKINLVETGNTFVSSHENSLKQFGEFTSDDEL